MRHEAKCFVLAVGVMLMVASAAGQQFQLMEASINEIHRGLQSGKLTCHSLVQQYLDRIKSPPICRPPAHRWHSRACSRRRMRSRWRGSVKTEP